MNFFQIIKLQLIKNQITQFRILAIKETSFTYKLSFNKFFTEKLNLCKAKVIFANNGGISKFTISSRDLKQNLDKIIKSCKNNLYKYNLVWRDLPLSQKIDNNSFEIFKDFNNEKYAIWLKKELESFENINWLYKIKLYHFYIITRFSESEKYKIKSNFICAENNFFQKQAFFNDKFLDDNLSEEINKMFKGV